MLRVPELLQRSRIEHSAAEHDRFRYIHRKAQAYVRRVIRARSQ